MPKNKKVILWTVIHSIHIIQLSRNIYLRDIPAKVKKNEKYFLSYHADNICCTDPQTDEQMGRWTDGQTDR